MRVLSFFLPMKPRKKTLPEIIALARELRQQETMPEILLWSILRNRQVEVLKFRRQHDLEPYVADFYCAEAKLVIELDGESHVGQALRDELRTMAIETHGLRVLRYTNDEVLQYHGLDAASIADTIASSLGRRA